MRRSPFSSVLKLGELNRLQQNFPYSDERHSMLVAIGTDNTVIGFVDLDNRPATRRIDPPRPYLSDLAVHLDYRRQGIATTLIETCQDMVLQQWQAKELYIRVERANHVAVQMYQRFDYRPMDHAIFGVEDTTVLLRKIFEANETTTLDYSV
jgi:ribosomal protein S18 acetylase RimI-like enzyme